MPIGNMYGHQAHRAFIAVGFWPGDARFPHAALYAYMSPAPEGTAELRVQPPRLGVEPLQRLHFLIAAKFCALHRRLQNPDGLVIDLDRNWIGMPVLAAVGN